MVNTKLRRGQDLPPRTRVGISPPRSRQRLRQCPPLHYACGGLPR